MMVVGLCFFAKVCEGWGRVRKVNEAKEVRRQAIPLSEKVCGLHLRCQVVENLRCAFEQWHHKPM